MWMTFMVLKICLCNAWWKVKMSKRHRTSNWCQHLVNSIVHQLTGFWYHVDVRLQISYGHQHMRSIWCQECVWEMATGHKMLWTKFDVNVQHQFDANNIYIFHLWLMVSWYQLLTLFSMPCQHLLPTGHTGGNMSALCLVLIIYFCLSFRAFIEVNPCPKNLNKHNIVIYCICKHSSTFIVNLTLSFSIVCRQLLVGCYNIYRMESHVANFTNAEGHYGSSLYLFHVQMYIHRRLATSN